MFEHNTAHDVARLIIAKAEWEKLFTLPDQSERYGLDDTIEQWSCGFVVMTESQFNTLTEMVMTLAKARGEK